MRNSLRKRILKASAMLASVTFFASGSMIDSRSWIPTIVCAGSILYLAVFAYANRHYKYEEGDFG
jgi:hypothetical protein